MSVLNILLPVLLLSGCATKMDEQLALFQSDKVYTKALENTRKGEILSQLETKALIIATHLNATNSKKFANTESFFVRLYIADDLQNDKKEGLFNPLFTLKLNGQAPLNIKEVDTKSDILKYMPFVKKWYKLYVVEFSKGSHLSLELRSDRFGKTVLKFD